MFSVDIPRAATETAAPFRIEWPEKPSVGNPVFNNSLLSEEMKFGFEKEPDKRENIG